MASWSACAPGEGVSSLPGDARRGGSGSGPDAPGRDETFPRAHRLTSRRQFLTVYAEGRRVGSRSFTLFGLPNGLEHSRLGITVTRKVGTAVRRNRIKRRLREIFRRNRDTVPVPLDIVVNAHRSMDESDASGLEAEFLRGVTRLARIAEG